MTLTGRQQAILDFIRDFSGKTKYPPTIREIGKSVGISSTSVVNYNLNVLEKQGHIARDKTISRGIKLVNEAPEMAPVETVRIPVLGRIAAGEPMPVPGSDFAILGDEVIELTRNLLPVDDKNVFALQVRGNSMVDAMIGDGDIVVMQQRQKADNGDLVAVWLKDREETTLKRFFLEKGKVRLQPANPTMQPIIADPKNVEVQGKVILVIRHPNKQQ
ncbi:MAG: transcriptional repressor LexA [Chloroflexi bacterium]|nr:transcriptional repressor LexA [Chloroflexota bacterium]